jgi:hypothetical protein
MQHNDESSSPRPIPAAVPPPVPPAAESPAHTPAERPTPPPADGPTPPAVPFSAPAVPPPPPAAATTPVQRVTSPADLAGRPAWPHTVWVLAACFLLLGILLNWGLHHRRARHHLQAQFQAIADDYALLRAGHGELGQLMANPQIQWTHLQPTNSGRFGAAVAWHPSRRDGALFLGAVDLLPAGQQYQLWIEPHGRDAVSAAVFDAPGGATVHFVRPAQPINGIRRLFITVEPAGGNPRPSGRQVASAELS